MQPAELKTWRESVGLSATDLADLLGVETRSINRWEAGTNPIPEDLLLSIQQQAQLIEHELSALRTRLLAERPAVLLRYRTPQDLKAHDPALWKAGVTVPAHASVLWAVHLETGAPITYR